MGGWLWFGAGAGAGGCGGRYALLFGIMYAICGG